MKTPEDEAFEDIERKQGMWGGGFNAKRKAAMDKRNAMFYQAYKKLSEDQINYGSSWSKNGERIDPASVYLEEPAQDGKCKLYHSTEARWCENFVEVKHPHIENEIVRFYFTQPVQRPWVGLTDEELADCLDMSIQKTCRAVEAKLKEKNT